MEFQEVITERRSIRQYRKQAVEKEQVEAIIQAAIYAPSWKNSQTARYHVVMSPELLETFKQTCLAEYNRKNCQNAPVLIVATFVKDRAGFNKDGTPTNEVGQGWGYYDCGLHNEILLLKAKEIGLDTLVMGIRDANAIRTLLQIPDSEIITAVISLGYRDIDPKMPERHDITDIAHFY